MFKPLKEIDENVLKRLYSLRTYLDADTPYENFISRYDFIVVDNTGYFSEKCPKWRMEEYEKIPQNSYKKAAIPCAIVKDSKVIKNRYGGQDRIEK